MQFQTIYLISCIFRLLKNSFAPFYLINFIPKVRNSYNICSSRYSMNLATAHTYGSACKFNITRLSLSLESWNPQYWSTKYRIPHNIWLCRQWKLTIAKELFRRTIEWTREAYKNLFPGRSDFFDPTLAMSPEGSCDRKVVWTAKGKEKQKLNICIQQWQRFIWKTSNAGGGGWEVGGMGISQPSAIIRGFPWQNWFQPRPEKNNKWQFYTKCIKKSTQQ